LKEVSFFVVVTRTLIKPTPYVSVRNRVRTIAAPSSEKTLQARRLPVLLKARQDTLKEVSFFVVVTRTLIKPTPYVSVRNRVRTIAVPSSEKTLQARRLPVLLKAVQDTLKEVSFLSW